MKPLLFYTLAVLFVLAAKPQGAVASDLGCQFMLCIAGNWRAIAECRPPVTTVLRGLARGRPIPTCNMQGGEANHAKNFWTHGAACPAIYSYWDESTASMRCTYPGVIHVTVNNQHWGKIYWDFQANTRTAWSPVALQALGSATDEYQQDVAAWNSTRVSECRRVGGTISYTADGAVLCTTPTPNPYLE